MLSESLLVLSPELRLLNDELVLSDCDDRELLDSDRLLKDELLLEWLDPVDHDEELGLLELSELAD